LARFTAATNAFSLHATGMVMACAAGATITRLPATAVAPTGPGQWCEHVA
jgi:hypothetical protein